MIGTLNEWIQSARALVAKGPHIPLIDDHAIKMDELWQMWLRGDDDLRAAIENALARDPDDLPSRFVALNAYYRLANSWSPAGVTIGGSSGGVNTEETLLPARDPASGD